MDVIVVPLGYLYLDLNAYFASVEQAENPELLGKPIIVVPMLADSTCAIAGSYEAKAYGIKTGTRVGDAKKMCPELVVVEARPPLYVHYHNRVIEELEGVLPVHKVCSVDEMSFKLIGREREPAVAQEIAREMKRRLRDNIAPNLSCSVGIASNSFLAKLATEFEKPDGLVTIEEKDLPDRLYGHKLTVFPGINKKMEARLRAAGIFCSDDLVKADIKHMLRAFGSVIGERWWYLLRGHDLPDQEVNRRSLGHSHVLPPDMRHDMGCREVLLRLLQKAAARMRQKELFASHMTVYVLGNERSWEDDTSLEPTNDSVTLTEKLLSLWKGRDFVAPKLVGVTFTGLCEAEGFTPSLFEEARPHKEFNKAVDTLNQRFGKNTVFLAGMAHAKDTASEKIAFNKTWLLSEGKGDNEWKKGPEG